MKNFLLNLFFPKFCLNCKKEGTFLCYDCFSLIPILEKTYCPFCHPAKPGKTCPSCTRVKYLDGLYAAVPCTDFIIKKIQSQFKQNHLKELAEPIAFIIISHLYFCNANINKNSVLIPYPCSLKEKKQIGFDPAEEINKQLAQILKIPLKNKVKKKNVFLVNDVFQENMDDYAKKLKEQGANQVFALTLIRD